MIIDTTGIVLTPGNFGKDCMGNGKHEGIECCCDECDYAQCCLESFNAEECLSCKDLDCPRALGKKWTI